MCGYGTGYSSLYSLNGFPVDVLKSDCSFIMNVTSNPADDAITTAIIGMAHRLDVKVLAEGVETVEQFNFLRMRGCDEIQGYYIAQPLPAIEISKLLSSNKKLRKPAQPLVLYSTIKVRTYKEVSL